MIGKKGMSPLIVTILLIAFAVALGTMIMNWTSDVVSATAVSCEDILLEVQELFDQEVLCFNEETSKIKFMIKNRGSSPMDYMIYRRIGSDYNSIDTKMPDSYLGPGKIYEADIKFEETKKIHIEFIPGIMQGGQEVLCPDQAIIREKLPPCNAE